MVPPFSGNREAVSLPEPAKARTCGKVLAVRVRLGVMSCARVGIAPSVLLPAPPNRKPTSDRVMTWATPAGAVYVNGVGWDTRATKASVPPALVVCRALAVGKLVDAVAPAT